MVFLYFTPLKSYINTKSKCARYSTLYDGAKFFLVHIQTKWQLLSLLAEGRLVIFQYISNPNHMHCGKILTLYYIRIGLYPLQSSEIFPVSSPLRTQLTNQTAFRNVSANHSASRPGIVKIPKNIFTAEKQQPIRLQEILPRLYKIYSLVKNFASWIYFVRTRDPCNNI